MQHFFGSPSQDVLDNQRYHISKGSSGSFKNESPTPHTNDNKTLQSKPMIERRRRARINEYLSELKLLIMDDLEEQPGRLSKIDKAELLECVVQSMKRKQESVDEQKPVNFYRLGVNECAWTVQHFLGNCDDVTPEIRTRLLDHVASWSHHNSSENQPPGVPFPSLTSTANHANVTSTRAAVFPHLFQLLSHPAENGIRASSRIPSGNLTPPPTTSMIRDDRQALVSGGKSCKSRLGLQSYSAHPYHSSRRQRIPLADRNENYLPDTTDGK